MSTRAISWTVPAFATTVEDPCFTIGAASTSLTTVKNVRKDRFARVYLELTGGAGGQTAVIQLHAYDEIIDQSGVIPINGTGLITLTEGATSSTFIDVELGGADLGFFVSTWTSGTVNAYVASND
jgi:hypothetical protein